MQLRHNSLVPSRAFAGAIVAVMFAVSACSTEPDIDREPTRSSASLQATIVANDPGLPGDPLTIESLAIAGDTLIAQVSHGGGCSDHVFRLVISPVFMESFPVQTRARISHNANGDVCRALLRRDLRMSLRPLADAYGAQYGQQTGTVMIYVTGANEPVLYKF
jgi:hypothetical protein